MRIKIILLIILTTSLSNCATYTAVPLPLPSEAVVKPYKQDLECLDARTRVLVVKGFKRITTLENIIKSTQ